MEYEVIKPFRDKYSREKYEMGTIITIPQKRATEILKVGKLIKKVENPEPGQNPEADE